MADKTKIEWTDATVNVFRGCTRVSEGCRNCYAERIAARFSGEGEPYEKLAVFVPHQYDDGTVGRDARWTGEITIVEDAYDIPVRWTKPRKIFINSMSDTFHWKAPEWAVNKLFTMMNETKRHTFQILTKRPNHVIAEYKHLDWTDNIWMGVSVEDTATLWRADDLIQWIPAKVKFISIEPLLEPIASIRPNRLGRILGKLDWVIVGGESGPRARPMQKKWATDIYKICKEVNTPFFFKQMGGRKNKGETQLTLPDGTVYQNQFPEKVGK